MSEDNQPQTTCKLCMNAPERNLTTPLGVGPICADCLDASAECPKALHQAYLDNKARGAKVPGEIIDRITIHIGDNRYLSLKEFYEKASQLPGPCLHREPTEAELEDEQLADLVALIIHETPTMVMWPVFETPSLLTRIIWGIQKAIYGPKPAIPLADTYEEKPR